MTVTIQNAAPTNVPTRLPGRRPLERAVDPGPEEHAGDERGGRPEADLERHHLQPAVRGEEVPLGPYVRGRHVRIGSVPESRGPGHGVDDEREQEDESDGHLAQHVVREERIRLLARVTLQLRHAVEPDQEDVAEHGDQEHGGDDADVEVVEARQRLRVDVGAAAQHVEQRRADQRDFRDHVRPHRRGPVGELVVDERVAGEREGQREEEEGHADDPGQLPGPPVPARDEDTDHVKQHRQDHELGRALVQTADQPAEPHGERDLPDALVGVHRIGDVVEGQQDAGHDLHAEEQRGRATEGPDPGLEVNGQALFERLPGHAGRHRDPLGDPVPEHDPAHAPTTGGRTLILTKTSPSRTSTG